MYCNVHEIRELIEKDFTIMSQKTARKARKDKKQRHLNESDELLSKLNAKVKIHLLDERLSPQKNICNILYWLKKHEGWMCVTNEYDEQIMNLLNTPKITSQVDEIINFDEEGWQEYAMQEASRHPLPGMTIEQSARVLIQYARTDVLNMWVGMNFTSVG